MPPNTKRVFYVRYLSPAHEAEQVLDILDGKRPPRLINPEVRPAYRARFARIMGFEAEA
jgi:hypothetical protein